MTFEDRFRAALLNYLKREVDQLAVEIHSFEDTHTIEGCDTCQWTSYLFDCTYFVNDFRKGKVLRFWTYTGGLSKLIRELTEDDE